MSSRSLDQFLMTALNFGPEDLEINRRGAVSPRQEELHQQQATRSRKGILRYAAFVPLIFVAVAAREVLLGGASAFAGLGNFQPIFLLPIGIVLLTLGGMIALGLFGKSSIARSHVEYAEGRVEIGLAGVGSAKTQTAMTLMGADPMRGRLKIGQELFYVSERVLRAFQPGAIYRVYYVRQGPVSHPSARTIISAEAVAES